MIGRKILHATLAASTASLALAIPAYAQDSDVPSREAGQQEAAPGDIIVTAQRR